MYKLLLSLQQQQVPATGIGLLRILFGLVTLQEILFLLYFNHLIFDPIPYMDVEFPMIPFFLCIWAIIAGCIVTGYRSQFSIIANYIFWITFVNFTPMQRDFDGGFDTFMIGVNFFLIFLPINTSFSLDNLRQKLNNPFKHYSSYSKPTVSILAYYLPIVICLGFLYFDSAVHKMFAPHWRNGLGAWLPASMPYYVSAINMSWLLNLESFQKIIGYTILVFQFSFIFLFHIKYLRPIYLLIGFGIHFGITISLNIYPFGISMLIFYVLLVPFSWYRAIANKLQAKPSTLSVFYDAQCPLCNRTILILNHFDILKRIEFKNVQQYAKNYPALDSISPETLLTDIYAIDNQQQIYAGVNSYAQILIHLRYPAILGYLLQLPAIFKFAEQKYRKIADSRVRLSCNTECNIQTSNIAPMLYERIFNPEIKSNFKKNIRILAKICLVLFVLQLNTTIHYGLLYRLNINLKASPITATLANLSNTAIMLSHTFVGITPHALYLHDHFAGYNHIIALTYLDKNGTEIWLPFVNKAGRLLAPNWGRVHSMWANIAITSNIDKLRLEKFIMKVTAFWGTKSELNLNNTVFQIKLKKIQAPFEWHKDLLNNNLSGSWSTIGTAKWQQKTIQISVPKDINLL